MRKIIQKKELNVVVYTLNFMKEKNVERLHNSTLITAGVLTFLTMEEADKGLS